MAIPYKTIYQLGFLGKLIHGLAKPDIILMEDIPSNYVDQITSGLWHYLFGWLDVSEYKVCIIKPSQWKGLVKRVEIPGQHARDAATMARWFINNGKKDQCTL